MCAHRGISRRTGLPSAASCSAPGPLGNSQASVPTSCFLNVKRDTLPLSCRGGLSSLSFCPVARFSSLTDKQRQHPKGSLPRTRAETGQQAEAGSPGSEPRVWHCGGLLMGLAPAAFQVDRSTRSLEEFWSTCATMSRVGGVLSRIRTLGSPESF